MHTCVFGHACVCVHNMCIHVCLDKHVYVYIMCVHTVFGHACVCVHNMCIHFNYVAKKIK